MSFSMSEADLRDLVSSVIKSDAPKQWDLEYNFMDGEVDSLDHVSIIMALQEKTGIAIDDGDMDSLNSLSLIMNYLSLRVS
jgi:acyl carrier protein